MNRKNQNLLLNIISVLYLVLLNAVTLFVLFNVTRYAAVSKTIFIVINVVVLCLLLLMNSLSIVALIKRNIKFTLILAILSCVLSISMVYVGWATTRVNESVDNIVVSGDTVTENVGVAFVTYNNTIILDIDDINGSKFGIIGNEEFLEGNVLAKAELDAKKIRVEEFVEYDNYTDLFLGLTAGEVDVAALPANYYDLFVANEGYEDLLEETEAIHKFTEAVEVANDFDSELDVTKDPFNILVMGNDGGRTDALIVLSVNPTTMDIAMTSIPRDSYVPIMCYNGQARDKITHARTVSRQCTIDTVENYLDIDINFFVETNFQGVVQIVDAMGGIQIDSPVEFTGQNSSEIRGTYSVHIFKGVQTVDGEGALCFARERKKMPGGDYQRAENQQQVIKAMITKAISIRDINKLLSVLEAAGENVKTNMSVNQMTSLLNYALKVIDSTYVGSERLLNIDSLSITGYSSYYYNTGAQLPLWISIPWKGATADAQSYLKDFLTKSVDKVLTVPSPFEYSITHYYDSEPIVASSYNEAKEQIEMPDMMPTMKFTMSLSEARAWAAARNIPLTVNYVRSGDPEYNDNYADGTILYQSVRYGIMTKNISSLTITAIQKLTEDQMIPNFIGQTYSKYNEWVKANGYTSTVNWIASSDSNYDASKAGKVTTQSIEAGLNKADHNSITVTAYDYANVTDSFKSAATSKASLDTWATANMVAGKDAITYKYVYSATESEGAIKNWSVVNVTGDVTDTKTVKTNSKLTVTVYTKDTNIANKFTVTFVGQNGAVIQKFTDVVEGSSVTPPTAPTVSGYTFSGWDSKAYENVKENLTITAKYTAIATPSPTPVTTPTTTPDTTDPQPTPDTTDPQPTPDTTDPQPTPDTTDPQPTPDNSEPVNPTCPDGQVSDGNGGCVPVQQEPAPQEPAPQDPPQQEEPSGDNPGDPAQE